MSKRRIVKAIIVGCVITTVGGYWKVTEIKANESNSVDLVQIAIEENGEVTPKANQLVWYYKEENGKKYRRLYDATDQKWLTDWILCG